LLNQTVKKHHKMENLETQNNENNIGDNPFITQPAVSSGKNALTYGLILGGISIVYSLILWVFGLTLNKPLSYVSMIFSLGVMFYGTKVYRDKYLGGFMSYGKAYTSNFLIGLYASIIGTIYTFILFKYIDPTLLNTIKDTAIEAAMQKNPNISQEDLEKSMGFFMTPLFMTFSTLFAGVFGSAIIALIVSFFHKKEAPII